MDSGSQKGERGLLAQARQLADAHSWSEAADLCKRALEFIPGDVGVLNDLGWYLSRAKRYDEAIEVYQDLVRKEPRKAKWPYMLGYQYYDQGQWRQALSWFDQALELWDAYLVVLYRKGYAHAQLDEKEQAEQAFRRCIAAWQGLDEENQRREANRYSDACFQLGKILLSRGQSRNAEAVLSEAVRCDSSDAYKYYNLGKALLKNGKPREALEQFQRASQYERKDYILVHMARAYTALHDYERAEATIERIPERRRKGYVWHELGKLRLAQEQPDAAVVALQRAIRLNPDNHNCQFLLGQAYEACEKLADAHKAYARAIELRRHHYGLEFREAQARLADVGQHASACGISLDVAESAEPLAIPDGHVKMFQPERGFGFISRDTGVDVFFHISEVANPDAIEVGAGVTFQVVESPKGLRATEVSVIS